MTNKLYEKGFTLIELMVTIALVAIGTVFMLQDVSATSAAKKANFQMEEFQDIVKSVSLLKDATSNYVNLSSYYLASHKILPSRYLNSANTGIVNAYGGNVIVSRWATVGYYIALYSLPQSGCMDFISKIETDTPAYLYASGGYVLIPSSTSKNLSIACTSPLDNNVIVIYIYN